MKVVNSETGDLPNSLLVSDTCKDLTPRVRELVIAFPRSTAFDLEDATAAISIQAHMHDNVGVVGPQPDF